MPARNTSPSTFDQSKADEIIDRLSAGETAMDISRSPGMPAYRTMRDWCKAHPAFDEAWGEARDLGYDAIATRTRKTARGKLECEGGDSSGDVQRDKLIIETDLKLLAKWDPRRYGDKTLHGNDPENPLPAPQFIINPIQPAPAKDE